LAQVSLQYNPVSQEVTSLTMDYIPLWVDRYSNGERTVHTVIPQLDDISSNPSLQASGNLERALQAFAATRAVLGETISWNK
jgi:hypothetical protein